MGLLRLPGASLYFEDAGGSGYPVVFLHPASGSSESWRSQLPAFAGSGFRCITYDLRNWGRSRSESTDDGCFSDDLRALTEHLGLEKFALVGAAYGGFGAVDFAVRFPERLSALVLSGTQGGIADPVYTALRERVVSAPIRGLPLELRELGPSYRTRDPEGVEAWLAIAHAAGEPGASARQRMHRDIVLSDLEAVRVPTLLLAGGADLLAPPELMRRIAEHLPDQQLVVLGESGHCLHWEEPAEWNRLVLAFLQPLLR
jgi:2-succinyl-6-hydroxy-2,4-cyclohexadiene-1-carboxylate synthase